MHYQALATDYDGTIATDGLVSENTLIALKRWQQSGRKLILVTAGDWIIFILFFLKLDYSTVLWQKTAHYCLFLF